MAGNWLMDSPLDVDEIEEAARRKAVFREMGSEFVQRMKHGVVTDRPGTIARLMEKAYRAGLETGQAAGRTSASGRRALPARRMNDLDVPPLSRGRFFLFRLAIAGRGETGPGLVCKHPEAMAMYLRPGLPGYPPNLSRDEWLLAFAGGTETLGKKTISPLVRLGLLDEISAGDRWRVAVWTEWGFELLLRGETSMPGARTKGGSSTFAEWSRIVRGEPDILGQAARALGIVKEAP